jgi:hypothetical protein
METVSTAKDAAQRLEDYVSRHGCGLASCSLCDYDLETCLAVNVPARAPAASLAPRLPAVSPDSPAVRRAALIEAQAAAFSAALPCY